MERALHGQHGGQGQQRRIDDEDEAATALVQGQRGGQGTQRRIDDEGGGDGTDARTAR